MKKILFPTDFSPNANLALSYAARFCRLHNCELLVLHACHVNAFAYQLVNEETQEDIILDTANTDLTEYCNKNSSTLGDIKFTMIVEYGFAADSIVDSAKKNEVDMIIMGTKGISGIDEYLIGSNTMSVINKASCPVLAIPEQSNLKNFTKIVFATDYRENDIESIKFLSTIAAIFQAEIIILHVKDFMAPITFEDALLEIFKDDVKKNIAYNNISFHVLKGLSHSEALNEYLVEHNIDLVAVSTRKRNLLNKIFDTSFTKKMLYHTHIPLLAFHPKEKKNENAL